MALDSVIFSEVAGSAWLASRRPDGSPWPTWDEWYRNEREVEHRAILRDSQIVCTVNGACACIDNGDYSALAKWLKANKAPARRGRPKGSRNAPKAEPTISARLITSVLNLIAEIERRDGEGNVIPDYLYAPVRAALAEV